VVDSEEGQLMASKFLDKLSLAKLIAPISTEKFFSEYWEQKTLIVHRNDPNYYGDTLTLEDFDRHIACHPDYIKTAEATTKSSSKTGTDSTKGVEDLLAQMWNGHTLVLDGLNRREPKLDHLCRMLQREFGHTFQTNCYLTPPGGKGFTPHWDNHDVFVLQVLGSKHWQVEHERRRLPAKTDVMKEDEGRVIREDAHVSFTLKQGDLIYIPRGVVHAAACGEEPSLHITLGLHPRTWEDLLNGVVADSLSQQGESIRFALPPGFMTGHKDELVKGVLKLLKHASDPQFVSAAIDRFRDTQVTKQAPNIAGQIVDYFRPQQITAKTTLKPRPGTVSTMYNGGDAVLVNYAGRAITFLGMFKEAIVFALNTPSYTVADLPGDLEEEEKVALVERLMQEGLIVRP
jgi:ribosomal protein L16 Arg81 hydroxylase